MSSYVTDGDEPAKALETKKKVPLLGSSGVCLMIIHDDTCSRLFVLAIFTSPRKVELDLGTTHRFLRRGHHDKTARHSSVDGTKRRLPERKFEANGVAKTAPQNGASYSPQARILFRPRVEGPKTGPIFGSQKRHPEMRQKCIPSNQSFCPSRPLLNTGQAEPTQD